MPDEQKEQRRGNRRVALWLAASQAFVLASALLNRTWWLTALSATLLIYCVGSWWWYREPSRSLRR